MLPTHKRRFEGEWGKLADICRPKQWKTIPKTALKEQGYPVYGANGVIGRFDSYNHEHETILIGCRGTCGNVFVCEPYSYVTGNAMCLDELNSAVDMRYLECYLQSYDFSRVISGTSQPQITRQGLSKVLIPLAPFDVQLDIAADFAHLSSIEDNCKKQLNELDDLVKSRFIEMIGDPLTAKTPWKAVPLGESCEIVTGNTPPRADKNNYGDYIEWCKTDNITDDKYLTTATEMLSEVGATKSRIAPEGSILMACIAGSMKSIGKVAVANRRVAFNQQINAVIPGSDLQTDYLLWLLKLSKDYLCSSVNMQLKGILNKSALSAKVFPVPPLALQQEFANFVTQVDKLRFDVQQQIEKLETLKQSLMQEYFG